MQLPFFKSPGAPRVGFSLLLMSSWALLLLGCRPGVCSGPECNCEGQNECIVSCEHADCDIACGHTAESCGAICGDNCKFECSNTNHCSSYSGVGSEIECHHVPSCAAECGADCHYVAYDISEVHVSVGPQSTVECHHAALCKVECRGECQVFCENTVSRCEVECLDGNKKTDASGETIECR